MADLYPYAHGDAFEERRRYNYAPYGGRPFLRAWSEARRQLMVTATPAAASAGPLPTSAVQGDALDELARAWQRGAGATEWQGLRRLIQHFEVGQRIYGAYRSGFVPLDRSDYRGIERYLLATHIFESAYTQGRTLDALNALLKALDLLSTRVQDLDASQQAQLGHLAQREAEHVERLARNLGVSW